MSIPVAEVEKLIKSCGVSIISSVAEDGFPNTKAMLPPRQREGIKTFYFTTNTSSQRVGQYRKNCKACIYFFDQRSYLGVMLVGNMQVLTDKKTKTAIWQDGDTQYYALGVDDPDYCVLKFTAEKMRTYRAFSSETTKV
jgi:general stress protein 26